MTRSLAEEETPADTDRGGSPGDKPRGLRVPSLHALQPGVSEDPVNFCDPLTEMSRCPQPPDCEENFSCEGEKQKAAKGNEAKPGP